MSHSKVSHYEKVVIVLHVIIEGHTTSPSTFATFLSKSDGIANSFKKKSKSTACHKNAIKERHSYLNGSFTQISR